MEGTEIPASVRVTGEASSLVLEWSHDVCRFLLKWLKLSQLKSQKAAEDNSPINKHIGMSNNNYASDLFGIYMVCV